MKFSQFNKYAISLAGLNSVMALAQTTPQNGSGGDAAKKAIDKIENNLSEPLCAVYSALTGPFVIAAIVLAIVIGGILKLVGNRNAMTVIFSALTAGLIIFLAATITSMVLGNKKTKCETASIGDGGRPSVKPVNDGVDLNKD